MIDDVFLAALVIAIFLDAAWIWLRKRSKRRQIRTTKVADLRDTPRPLTSDSSAAAAVHPFGIFRLIPTVDLRARSMLLVLLLAALALSVQGQLYFEADRPNPSPNGLTFYVVAILVFVLAVVRADRFSRQPGETHHLGQRARVVEAYGETVDAAHKIRWPPAITSTLRRHIQTVAQAARHHPLRSIALMLAVLLTVWLLHLLRVDPPLPDYTLTFVIWLSAIGLYLLAVLPLRPRHANPSPSRSKIAGGGGSVPSLPVGHAADSRAWEPALLQKLDLPSLERKIDWRIALMVGVILLVAFALRVWELESIPPTLAGDEGTFGLESIKTFNGDVHNRNPFVTGWFSVPTLTFHFNAIALRLLGQSVFALRLPWALVGTITVLIVFRLVTRLSGPTLGLMTAALLATYHFHIHYSRIGINNAADPFLMALVLLLLYRAYDRRSLRDWALCGVVVGLAQYFYFGARFAIIVVGVLMLYWLVRDGRRFWREQRRGIAILLGAAIVTAAPMIQYAIRFPDDYNARVNQIGIIHSGWLEREQEIRNQSALPILLDQLQRAALAFNLYPDRTGWYGSPQPLFDFAAGILFLLGLGYATLRPADHRAFPMVVWWWGATVLGGALTESPPSTQRLITLAPPAVFFVALALLKIGQILQRALQARLLERLTPYLGAAVLGLSLISIKWYFVDFTPLRVYGGFNAVVAAAMGTYARDSLGSDWRMYFFGPPRIYILFGSIPYLAPEVEGVDVVEPLTAPPDPDFAGRDKNAAFVFLPERRGELDWVRQTFPGGRLEEMPSPWDGPPLFIVYRVPLSTSTTWASPLLIESYSPFRSR